MSSSSSSRRYLCLLSSSLKERGVRPLFSPSSFAPTTTSLLYSSSSSRRSYYSSLDEPSAVGGLPPIINETTTTTTTKKTAGMARPIFASGSGSSVTTATTPLPKRIILLRHGESLGNVDENSYSHIPDWKIPLTRRGERQSLKAATDLVKLLKADKEECETLFAYCSPYTDGIFYLVVLRYSCSSVTLIVCQHVILVQPGVQPHGKH